ncbi:CD209 antigen-like protein [Labeo rohita]|uniref:CD209 antigen-like protein n=1 Tax=Labeo rohita TaxID=84645 RepID=A0A498LIK3_LABRO|nr:CD209 antigen-like protein [Labeo rohita]
MNMSFYGNMNIPGTHGMDKHEQEEMNIYANADASDDVRKEMDNSDTKRHQTPQHTEKWKCYQSNLYYFSSEKKSWTESRRYCTERGADLIIINNREEQEFVKKQAGDNNRVWIGLTDIDVEGTWKWVDGSPPTSGFWMSAEPNGKRTENCALTVVGEWADYPCTEKFNWMCEKSKINFCQMKESTSAIIGPGEQYLEISEVIYESVSKTELQDKDRETVEMMLDICDSVTDHHFRTETNKKLLQQTGSDTVKTRSSSAAVVCLVLLCVLLLTAVIVLCVHIHTNNTEDRDELLIKITNLTEERDLLLNTIKDFQTEKDQLVIQNQKLANEKKELQSKNDDLMKQRQQQRNDHLQNSLHKMSNDELHHSYINIQH